MADRIKAAAPMTASAQTTARQWLEAGLERAECLTRAVSGEGEHAEILATIIAMLDENARNRLLEEAAMAVYPSAHVWTDEDAVLWNAAARVRALKAIDGDDVGK